MSRPGNGSIRLEKRHAVCLLMAFGLAMVLVSSATSSDLFAGEGHKKVMLDRSILDDPTRPEEEKKQDKARKALDIYEWLGVHPGMTVADVFCSGGYNTHLLSRAVGEKGTVYSIFEFYSDKEAFGGQLYKVDKVNKRVADSKLNNVKALIHTSEMPADSVDVMLAVRNYHDVEWVFDGLTRADFTAAAYKAMKPGGVFGIVELVTPREGWDEETHRLNEKIVIADFEKAGFKLAGRSDMLANPDDDHSKSGFKEGRYNLDRYLLKFEKPSKKSS